MVDITFVIPYNEITNEVSSSLADVKEEGINFKTTYMVGTKEVSTRSFFSDIVIARGVTYLALKEKLKDIPVIEIAVTGYDVIRAIDECKRSFNTERIAVIGSESMIFGAESLNKIMNVKLHTFQIKNEQGAVEALEMARKNNCEAIVGGLMTYNIAKSMGWNSVWIKTGKEAIRQAIREAINSADVVTKERAKTELLKIILDKAKDGIIAVDKDGYISAINKTAYRNLDIDQNCKINEITVKKIFSQPEVLNAIKKAEKLSGAIYKIRDKLAVVNINPIKVNEKKEGAVISIQNVDEIQEIESKIRRELGKKGLVAKYTFNDIAGKSSELKATIETAYKFSQVDSNILLIGETGTGKELFAQSIHSASIRTEQPFVAVNCAALPENLLESELFGYVEGAFSGAVKGGKAGLFELAHNGTIFLDEIGEMPPNLQAKLLRVLQENEVRRIGDSKVIPVNVRVISATNTELPKKIENGDFRQDLFYRLDVLHLNIPPLRKRIEDLKLLFNIFIHEYAEKFKKTAPLITIAAYEALSQYAWPGNIRELKNICERLIVLDEKGEITEQDIRKQINYSSSKYFVNINPESIVTEIQKAHSQYSLKYAEKETITNVLRETDFNKTKAAKRLGISRTTLWRKLKEMNIENKY